MFNELVLSGGGIKGAMIGAILSRRYSSIKI